MIEPSEESQRPRRLVIWIGVALIMGLAGLPIASWLAPGDSMTARVARELIWFLMGGVAIGYIVAVERRGLASLGFRSLSVGTFGWGLAASICMLGTVIFSYAVLFPLLGLSMNRQAVASVTHVPLSLQTLTMIRAGVVEEILFRGYLLERLATVTGRRSVGATLSAAYFIVVHIGSWGYAQLIVVTFGAVILTALYLFRRDLICNMFAHSFTDFIGFMLARLQGA